MKQIEDLLETITPERQERLLNPQMSDWFRTLFLGKYGFRVYDIKVGRKWVMMRSNNHRARIPVEKFKTLAFVTWRRDCETATYNPKETRKREWYKDYGFNKPPRDYFLDPKHLHWT